MTNDEIARFFSNTRAFIQGNSDLRDPQVGGWFHTRQHFRNSSEHAILQIQVGCGKTGLMALLPFGIAQGRVLDGQEAMENSDKQNTHIEHNKALGRVMVELIADHTELFYFFKQFSDNHRSRNSSGTPSTVQPINQLIKLERGRGPSRNPGAPFKEMTYA